MSSFSYLSILANSLENDFQKYAKRKKGEKNVRLEEPMHQILGSVHLVRVAL